MTTTTETPTDTELAAHLRVVIARTARRLRQQGGEGLSPSQASALVTLHREGALTPSALATAERVSRPTVTRLIARLEEQGYVTRADDPDDGRSCRLALTPHGEDTLATVRGRKTAYLARALEHTTPQERATLERAAALLERLLEETA